MGNRIAVIGLLCFCCIWTSAQRTIELHLPKQHVDVRLYDENDDFLLTLPLTFSMTDKNILIMMAGNDSRLADEQSIWMFSSEIDLADLIKTNHNVGTTQSFKKENMTLNKVLRSNPQINIHRKFDDGYEIIKKNSKPVFFKIDNSPSKSLSFYLQFYVTKSDNKYPYVFIAKCNPVEIKMNY